MNWPSPVAWVWTLVPLLLAACASAPQTAFYTLALDSAPASVADFPAHVAIGPIDLPDYLDRPQIVTRIGENRLRVDEFNRWGGRLDEQIDHVLQRGLGSALGRDRVFGHRSGVGVGRDYRIALQVLRFDGTPDGDVVLDVAWSVIDETSLDVVAHRRDRYVAAWNGTGYDAYAATLSGLLARLVGDVAPVLRQVAGAG